MEQRAACQRLAEARLPRAREGVRLTGPRVVQPSVRRGWAQGGQETKAARWARRSGLGGSGGRRGRRVHVRAVTAAELRALALRA